MTYATRITCRLCDCVLSPLLDFPATPPANEYPASRSVTQTHYPLSLSQCDVCGHVQCPVVIDPHLLFGEYAYTTSTAASMRKHVAQLADEIATPGSVIVDIGSNDGLLLAEAHQRGARAIGVDPARNLAAEATARGRITLPAAITPSLAIQVRNLIGQPCTVTALNVFAHADDLGSIADAVRELIQPTGVFIFEVAYLLDVVSKNEIGTIYHEHLSHHHVTPLVAFFRRHGLELVTVEKVASQGGSIRCMVKSSGVPGASVVAAMHYEADHLPRLLRGWLGRIDAERIELAAELEPYRGKGLAVYGAPARLTTYAHTMGLQRDDVTCVFDGEPRKLGRFTPGLAWPIVPSSELMARNPPAILISAWPYAAEIKARFPDYRGAWIVPPRSEPF